MTIQDGKIPRGRTTNERRTIVSSFFFSYEPRNLLNNQSQIFWDKMLDEPIRVERPALPSQERRLKTRSSRGDRQERTRLRAGTDVLFRFGQMALPLVLCLLPVFPIRARDGEVDSKMRLVLLLSALIYLAVAQYSCFAAPSSPGDRRSDKNTLTVVTFNVEFLFLSTPLGCLKFHLSSSWSPSDTMKILKYMIIMPFCGLDRPPVLSTVDLAILMFGACACGFHAPVLIYNGR
jgi:hypothetical protein